MVSFLELLTLPRSLLRLLLLVFTLPQGPPQYPPTISPPQTRRLTLPPAYRPILLLDAPAVSVPNNSTYAGYSYANWTFLCADAMCAPREAYREHKSSDDVFWVLLISFIPALLSLFASILVVRRLLYKRTVKIARNIGFMVGPHDDTVDSVLLRDVVSYSLGDIIIMEGQFVDAPDLVLDAAYKPLPTVDLEDLGSHDDADASISTIICPVNSHSLGEDAAADVMCNKDQVDTDIEHRVDPIRVASIAPPSLESVVQPWSPILEASPNLPDAPVANGEGSVSEIVESFLKPEPPSPSVSSTIDSSISASLFDLALDLPSDSISEDHLSEPAVSVDAPTVVTPADLSVRSSQSMDIIFPASSAPVEADSIPVTPAEVVESSVRLTAETSNGIRQVISTPAVSTEEEFQAHDTETCSIPVTDTLVAIAEPLEDAAEDHSTEIQDSTPLSDAVSESIIESHTPSADLTMASTEEEPNATASMFPVASFPGDDERKSPISPVTVSDEGITESLLEISVPDFRDSPDSVTIPLETIADDVDVQLETQSVFALDAPSEVDSASFMVINRDESESACNASDAPSELVAEPTENVSEIALDVPRTTASFDEDEMRSTILMDDIPDQFACADIMNISLDAVDAEATAAIRDVIEHIDEVQPPAPMDTEPTDIPLEPAAEVQNEIDQSPAVPSPVSPLDLTTEVIVDSTLDIVPDDNEMLSPVSLNTQSSQSPVVLPTTPVEDASDMVTDDAATSPTSIGDQLESTVLATLVPDTSSAELSVEPSAETSDDELNIACVPEPAPIEPSVADELEEPLAFVEPVEQEVVEPLASEVINDQEVDTQSVSGLELFSANPVGIATLAVPELETAADLETEVSDADTESGTYPVTLTGDSFEDDDIVDDIPSISPVSAESAALVSAVLGGTSSEDPTVEPSEEAADSIFATSISTISPPENSSVAGLEALVEAVESNAIVLESFDDTTHGQQLETQDPAPATSTSETPVDSIPAAASDDERLEPTSPVAIEAVILSPEEQLETLEFVSPESVVSIEETAQTNEMIIPTPALLHSPSTVVATPADADNEESEDPLTAPIATAEALAEPFTSDQILLADDIDIDYLTPTVTETGQFSEDSQLADSIATEPLSSSVIVVEPEQSQTPEQAADPDSVAEIAEAVSNEASLYDDVPKTPTSHPAVAVEDSVITAANRMDLPNGMTDSWIVLPPEQEHDTENEEVMSALAQHIPSDGLTAIPEDVHEEAEKEKELDDTVDSNSTMGESAFLSMEPSSPETPTAMAMTAFAEEQYVSSAASESREPSAEPSIASAQEISDATLGSAPDDENQDGDESQVEDMKTVDPEST